MQDQSRKHAIRNSVDYLSSNHYTTMKVKAMTISLPVSKKKRKDSFLLINKFIELHTTSFKDILSV